MTHEQMWEVVSVYDSETFHEFSSIYGRLAAKTFPNRTLAPNTDEWYEIIHAAILIVENS